MKKDIHVIDNYLIRIGYLLLLVVLMDGACGAVMSDTTAYIVEENDSVRTVYSTESLAEMKASHPDAVIIQEQTTQRPDWLIWIYRLAPFAMLVTGYAIRFQENKIIAVWNILEREQEMSVDQLSRSTGMDRDFLLKSVQLINRQGGETFLWIQESDVFRSTRVKQKTVYVDKCGNCGATVGKQIAIGAIPPVCPYCSHALVITPPEPPELNPIQVTSASTPVGKFNPALFIFLLIFAWPGALIYALYKSGRIRFFGGLIDISMRKRP